VTGLSVWAHLACGGSAVGAGIVNAIAGGGTLISFPAMTAVGVTAVRANATNTVSLCPGYIGGTFAQRAELEGLGRELRPQLVTSAVCGLAGSILLVLSSEAVFRSIVPFLILAACLLLAVQVPMRKWLFNRSERASHPAVELGAVGIASVYGGYFGAGLGIMLMAVLGLFSDHPLTKVNAVKQLLSIAVNVCAAAFLVFSGKIEWTLVAVMAPGALIGGNLGGRLAGVIPPGKLRACVVTYGVVVAIVYFVR
jgi:uncharacterized membrane protein YfcA